MGKFLGSLQEISNPYPRSYEYRPLRVKGNLECSSVLSYRAINTQDCSWTLRNISLFQEAERCKSKAFHLDTSVIWCELEYRRNYFILKLHYEKSGTRNRNDLVNVIGDIRNSRGQILRKMNNCEDLNSMSCMNEPLVLFEMSEHDLLHFLKDGTLVVHLRLTYVFRDLISEEKLKENLCKNMISDTPKLIQDFGSLYKSGKMTDAVVVVGDTKIQVHAVVLAARSKVLAATFENEFLEGQTRRIEISDFSAENIKCMLEFLYCGSVEKLDVEKALDLLRAADKYDVPDLTAYCCKFLRGHINEETVIPIIVLADMFSIVDLKKRAFDYLTKNKSSVSIDEHKSWLETRPSVLFEIISHLQKL